MNRGISKIFSLLLVLSFPAGIYANDCGSCETTCQTACNSCDTVCSTGCDTSCDTSCGTTCCSYDSRCGDLYCSRTFQMPRTITYDPTYEYALTFYHIYHNRSRNDEGCPWIYFHATPFYQQSANRRDEGRYFAPYCNNPFTVASDGTGDVNPLWLQVTPSDTTVGYRSCMSLCPKRKVVGAHLNFRFDLGGWSDCWDCLRDSWINVSFTPMQVKHELNPRAVVDFGSLVDADGNEISIVEAFNNPSWTGGRIYPCDRKRSGVDEVMFKWGHDFFFCDRTNHVGLYGLVTAPTGTRPCGEYLFEPVVGTRHASVGLGLNGDINLWECDNHNLNFLFDVNYRYLFLARERRSFDLCGNGDFSRYLLVVEQGDVNNPQPGVNWFTRNVRVEPRSQVNVWGALHYEWCNWQLEFGYNLFYAQRERVLLDCPPACHVGIFDLCNCETRTSASTAEVWQSCSSAGATGENVVVSDSEFTSTCDLNLNSAETPRVLTNKIYGALGYQGAFGCDDQYPWILGVGGGFEFANRNSALENWSVWGKVGIGF